MKMKILIYSVMMITYTFCQTNTTNTMNTSILTNLLNTTTNTTAIPNAITFNTSTFGSSIDGNTLASNYICSDQFKNNIEIGQNTTICIHFFPRPYRMAFLVKVDEYSVLSIGGAYNYVSQDSLTTQSFLFQIGKNLTAFPSLYYDKVNKFIVPVFNIVIKVDKGNITDVVWDNDCYSCLTSDTCYTNDKVNYLNDTTIKAVDKNCKQELCVVSKESAFQCDPKFYITWFGTDVNGKQLKSSNLSMSRFRQYAIGSLYNSAKDAFNTTISTLQSTWDVVKTKTDQIIKGNFS